MFRQAIGVSDGGEGYRPPGPQCVRGCVGHVAPYMKQCVAKADEQDHRYGMPICEWRVVPANKELRSGEIWRK